MDDKEKLVSVTIRITEDTNEKLKSLAQSNKCSIANIVRLALDEKLDKHLENIEYINQEQGDEIKEVLSEIYSAINKIHTDIKRIGTNFNTEVRLLSTQHKLSEQTYSVKEFLDEFQKIQRERALFTPDYFEELLYRYQEISERIVNTMAYTRISHTRNGKGAIDYVLKGPRHDGLDGSRAALVGTVGLFDDSIMPIEKQMEAEFSIANQKDANQVRRIIASFSNNELPKEDPNSAYILMEISREFVETHYKGHKALIVVHDDSANLHAHIILCNINSITNKGCTKEQSHYKYVEKFYDEIASKYITLEAPSKGCKDRYTQTERHIRDMNKAEIESGNVPYHYGIKDDLKTKIRIAMMHSLSVEDFQTELNKMNIECKFKESSITYKVLELPQDVEIDTNRRSFRSGGLGDDFGIEALHSQIQRNVENKSTNRATTLSPIPVEKLDRESNTEMIKREPTDNFDSIESQTELSIPDSKVANADESTGVFSFLRKNNYVSLQNSSDSTTNGTGESDSDTESDPVTNNNSKISESSYEEMQNIIYFDKENHMKKNGSSAKSFSNIFSTIIPFLKHKPKTDKRISDLTIKLPGVANTISANNIAKSNNIIILFQKIKNTILASKRNTQSSYQKLLNIRNKEDNDWTESYQQPQGKQYF